MASGASDLVVDLLNYFTALDAALLLAVPSAEEYALAALLPNAAAST